MKASIHWSMASTWHYVSIEYLKKKMFFSLSKVLKKEMYFLPLWCQTIYGWRGLWRGRSSPPGTNKPCPAALFLFPFLFYLLPSSSVQTSSVQSTTVQSSSVQTQFVWLSPFELSSLESSPLKLSPLHPSSSHSSPSKPSWHLHRWDRRQRRWFWSDRSKQLRTQIARCGLQRCPVIVRLLIIVIIILIIDNNSKLSCIIRLLITLNLFIL